MLDLHELRLERDHLRRVGEAEAKIRGSIEQKRRAVAEKRAALEAQLLHAEEALQKEKEAALKIHAEVAAECAKDRAREAHGGLSAAWPEVEDAASRVKKAEADLAETRRLIGERAEAEQRHVEETSNLYQMCCAATGVRWNLHASGVEGYVALNGKARAFEVSPSQAADRKATADALWAEIESCLPSSDDVPVAPLSAPAAAAGLSTVSPSAASSVPAAPLFQREPRELQEPPSEQDATEAAGPADAAPDSAPVSPQSEEEGGRPARLSLTGLEDPEEDDGDDYYAAGSRPGST